MATEYKLSYTAQEIDEKLGKIVDLDTTLTQRGKAADAKAVGDAIEEAMDALPQKYASVIINQSEQKHTFDAEELTNATSVVIPKATEADTEYIAFARDLIPALDATTHVSGFYRKGIGNTLNASGTLTSELYYYGRFNAAGAAPLKHGIAAGESATFFATLEGSFEAEYGWPVTVYFLTTDINGVRTTQNVSFGSSQLYKSITITAEIDIVAIDVWVRFMAGTYNNCVVRWAGVKNASVQPFENANGITLKKIEVGSNGITMLPTDGYYTSIADTKEYIDEHAPTDMVKQGDLNYITPEMFGAVGDGVVDDSKPLQDAFDYSAAKGKPLYVGGGTYLFKDVKLYDGNRYEVFGACFVDAVEFNAVPKACLLIKNGGVGFVGVRLTDDETVESLPTVRMVMRELKIKGQEGATLPMCFKDIRFANSRFYRMQAAWLSCFIEGMLVGDTLVEDCEILCITECAFRGWTEKHGIIGTTKHSFVDARFINSRYSGQNKWGTRMYTPSVFEADTFFDLWFSINFVTNMWAVVKSINGLISTWYSSDNIYTYCSKFAYKANDSVKEIKLSASQIHNDSVWCVSEERLVNSAEGKSYYDDFDGNTRLDINNMAFFDFAEFDSCDIQGIRMRSSSKLLRDVTRFKCTHITKAVLSAMNAYEPYRLSEMEIVENAFDTKFPISDYTANVENYAHTYIEPWNGKTVETLPPIQDESYRYVLEGQTCYHNHKLLTCHGGNWYDTMGNVVTN